MPCIRERVRNKFVLKFSLFNLALNDVCVLYYLRVGIVIYGLTVHFDGTGRVMPKSRKGFRLNPQLYGAFKESAAKNGYTVTGAFEKFMASAVEFGLSFPSAVKTEHMEAEARVMLVWLKKNKYWVNLGGKEETSTRG